MTESLTTATLTRQQWAIILKRQPVNQEAYSPGGLAAFEAWAALTQQVGSGNDDQ